MINCKACNKEIAKGVKMCPNCGKDQRNFFMRHKILTGILVIVLLIAIGAAINGNDKPTSGGEKEISQTEKSKEEEVKTEFKVGEIISYKDFDLVFENKRNVKGITDTSYTMLDVSIVSKKDNFTFTGDIQGVTADNEVVDDTIPLVSDNPGDPIMTAWTKTLNKEQKASGYVAFNKKISKIEVRSSLFSNDVITINLD